MSKLKKFENTNEDVLDGVDSKKAKANKRRDGERSRFYKLATSIIDSRLYSNVRVKTEEECKGSDFVAWSICASVLINLISNRLTEVNHVRGNVFYSDINMEITVRLRILKKNFPKIISGGETNSLTSDHKMMIEHANRFKLGVTSGHKLVTNVVTRDDKVEFLLSNAFGLKKENSTIYKLVYSFLTDLRLSIFDNVTGFCLVDNRDKHPANMRASVCPDVQFKQLFTKHITFLLSSELVTPHSQIHNMIIGIFGDNFTVGKARKIPIVIVTAVFLSELISIGVDINWPYGDFCLTRTSRETSEDMFQELLHDRGERCESYIIQKETRKVIVASHISS